MASYYPIRRLVNERVPTQQGLKLLEEFLRLSLRGALTRGFQHNKD